MIKKIVLIFFCFAVQGIFISTSLHGQVNPNQAGDTIFESDNMQNQFDYVLENSRTYVNNKVVKIDWLNKLKKNILEYQTDANNAAEKKRSEINVLKTKISNLESELDLEKTKLEETTHQVDNIVFLGADMLKSTFVLLFWSLTGILTILLAYFMIKFKQSINSTKEAQEELSEARESFEDLRKKKMEKEQELMRKLQDEINKHN